METRTLFGDASRGADWRLLGAALSNVTVMSGRNALFQNCVHRSKHRGFHRSLDFQLTRRETEGWVEPTPELEPVGRLSPALSSREANVPPLLSAPEVLNRDFLEIRCKILDLAAAFDRLQRADGSIADDPRLARLREALATVLERTDDRAEQVQMIFSRDYDDNWQQTLNVNVE